MAFPQCATLDTSTSDVDGVGTVEGSVVLSVLVANSPQLILSILYFAVNTVLTAMSSANEWSHFSVSYADKNQPQPLMTSNPVGQQRRARRLQLPFQLFVSLVGISILLHWLISQSIFQVVVSRYKPNGSLYNAFSVATCGFSPISMIFVIVSGIVMLMCLLGISVMRVDGTVPVVSSCSAAISAAYNLRGPMTKEKGDVSSSDAGSRSQMVEGPLVWGRVAGDMGSIKWKNSIDSEELKQYSSVSGEELEWRERVRRPGI